MSAPVARRRLRFALVALAAALAAGPETAGAQIGSTFDSDTDGWGHAILNACGDTPTTAGTAPTWVSSGGNPGGLIRITPPGDNLWSYWSAPSKFLGARGGYAGGQLSFDVRADGILDHAFNCQGPSRIADVELVGAGRRIEYDIPGTTLAANTWHTLVVPLSPAGWTYVGTTTAVTGADFATTLNALAAMHLRGEWVIGPEVDDLDNVRLIDLTPPDTTIDDGPPALTRNRTPTFRFHANQPGAAFQCRLDSLAFAGCSSPHTTAALPDGRHVFQVRATEVSGLIDNAPATRIFTVDRTPPQTVITAGPEGETDDNTPTFEFRSNEEGARFVCSVDEEPFARCSSPFTLPELKFGTHTFEVKAVDPAGNVDASPATPADPEAALREISVLAGKPTTPVVGKTFNVKPVGRGDVFVSLPAKAARASASVPGLKGRKFIPLRDARQVPVGSLLDTRKGKVRLTSARDSKGRSQSSDFSAGVFQVLQSRKKRARGLTELRLKGASFASCGRRVKRSGEPARAARSRTIRRLRGRGRGRFRTRGRYASATVRGTDWTVIDRCDGTLTKVGRGRVAVRDLRRKRTVLLRAGRSYLVRSRG